MTYLARADDTGHAYSWGYGECGALGHGDEENQLRPRRIQVLADVRIWAVAAGGGLCLALSNMGSLYSWGYGGLDQLGHGDRVDQHLPRLVEKLVGVRVTAVAAGNNHSLAVSGAGSLYAWGSGCSGRLGHGNTLQYLRPKVVEALGGVACVRWRRVAATASR